MYVDLPFWNTSDTPESVREVLSRSLEVALRTMIVREMFRDGREGNLFFEEIDFVKEEDNGFPLEPLPIHQGLKKHHCLVHLVLQSRRQYPPAGQA